MEIVDNIKILPMSSYNYEDKTVLLRLDINSPLNSQTKKIVNTNRIKMSLPTIKYLLSKKCKLVLIAHQGDTLDYQNLISLEEHALTISEMIGVPCKYIDDVCGPYAISEIKTMKPSNMLLLGNLRYLTEEISTFEDSVKLKPEEMLNSYIIRNLAKHFDYYVNDAFSAAHRNCPSMVAFQELLPTAGGTLLLKEISEISKILTNPKKPSVFVLGGAKISDAFGMMEQVLSNGLADKILTCGITGQIILIASGYDFGKIMNDFLSSKGLIRFVKLAKKYIKSYPNKIEFPVDFAIENNQNRQEISLNSLPINALVMDIGHKTVEKYTNIINNAKVIFANGPAGVFELANFSYGTKALLAAISKSNGYSVIGGGDTVSSATRFSNLNDFNYVSTAGGALIQYISGKNLPLIEAMGKAYNRDVIYLTANGGRDGYKRKGT